MPSPRKKPTRQPYIYIQETLTRQDGKDYMLHFMPSLDACVSEINRDADADVPLGTIYVCYSRVAYLLREVKKLEAENAKLKERIDNYIAGSSNYV